MTKEKAPTPRPADNSPELADLINRAQSGDAEALFAIMNMSGMLISENIGELEGTKKPKNKPKSN